MLHGAVAMTPAHQHSRQGGVVHGPGDVHPQQHHHQYQDTCDDSPHDHVAVIVDQLWIVEDVEPGDDHEDQCTQVLGDHCCQQSSAAPGYVTHAGGDLVTPGHVTGGQLQRPQQGHESAMNVGVNIVVRSREMSPVADQTARKHCWHSSKTGAAALHNIGQSIGRKAIEAGDVPGDQHDQRHGPGDHPTFLTIWEGCCIYWLECKDTHLH